MSAQFGNRDRLYINNHQTKELVDQVVKKE